MKRILTFAIIIASTYTAYSQSLGYNDLGILFSKDDNYGTARFEAMSGAFGALGGDISAFGINPAGSAVAIKSTFGVTLGNRNTTYTANYYGNTVETEDDFFNITQAGGILSFDSAHNSDWNRFALTFNYRIKKDFSGFHAAEGNSQYLTYNEHIADSKPVKTQFDRSINQYNSSFIDGESSVFSLGFSSVHQNKLHVGMSLNFHDLEFYREYLFNEINDDVDGNILDVENYTESYIQGTGFSIGLGFIYKFNQNIRLGLAYETPTWYQEVFEDYYDELLMKEVENLSIPQDLDIIGPESFVYKFKSPSRLTASGAYVIGKKGLISLDYTYKNFKSIKYSDGNFSEFNANFSNNYRNTHAVNIGTEWRFDKMSVRGGYHYEKDPNLLLGGNTNDDNIHGFSAGLGYNFGNMKVDLSYSKSDNNQYYTIYQNSDLNIENNTSRISGTITFSL
ncbi:OmpP1/FadL family transporter [Tenacibaculum sp. SDUM215027]|uniref:OmpP1/FadL family transporter n=1 Tax=Tenacibaculum sp. SDUM215027 TaxID=3422596 RepID=UPI003D3237C6